MLAALWQRVKNLFSSRAENGRLDVDAVEEIRGIIAGNNKKISGATLLEKVRFAVMDLETTGFAYGNGDEIIAVGAVLVEGGKVRPEKYFHQLVYPYRLVPGKVVDLTGIGRERLVGCPTFFGILPQFLEFLGNSVIVGHCIDFDLGFINAKLKQHCQVKIKNRSLDTSLLARALHPALGDYSLDSLLVFYGLEPAGRHTALGDALLTAELFVNLLASLKEQKVFTLNELDSFLRRSKQLAREEAVFIQ